jgi:hypothetical protein
VSSRARGGLLPEIEGRRPRCNRAPGLAFERKTASAIQQPGDGRPVRRLARAVGGDTLARSATLARETEMQTIRVLHCNSAGEGWTADSPDLDGWRVDGASYAQTRALAEDAVRSRLAAGGCGADAIASGDVEITHHIACSRG